MEKFYKTINNLNLPKQLVWFFIFIFVLVIIGGVFVWISAIGSFYEKYQTKVQWPVIIQAPLIITERVGSTLMPDIDALIEEEVNKRLQPTPTTKVIKAQIKLSYVQHEGKPYYNLILSKLKNLYTNWEAAAELIARESGFDPLAINPSSGACGLVQSLPCSKMKCDLSDIDCQLEWQKEYISQRYGTIDKALAYHSIKNWY